MVANQDILVGGVCGSGVGCTRDSLCAIAEDINRIYCCEPGENTCVQDNPVLCTGPNSNFTSSIPDSEQILCNNQFPESNIIEEWCCIDGVETCSDFMSCDSTLPNPFANTTVGQAVSLISQYSSATSSLTGISFIPFSTNGATISTDTSTSDLKQSHHISAGVKTGIAISVFAVVILVVLGIFLLVRRHVSRVRKSEASIYTASSGTPVGFKNRGWYELKDTVDKT